MWGPYENGNTIGKTGAENGITLRDEEYSGEARITLERDGYQPFAITCGIYDSMVHTAFASTLEEAESAFLAMKRGLETIIGDDSQSSYQRKMEKFVEDF